MVNLHYIIVIHPRQALNKGDFCLFVGKHVASILLVDQCLPMGQKCRWYAGRLLHGEGEAWNVKDRKLPARMNSIPLREELAALASKFSKKARILDTLILAQMIYDRSDGEDGCQCFEPGGTVEEEWGLTMDDR